MPLPLRSDEVSARLRDYSMENYLTIGATMKGVVLSMGAYVLLQALAGYRTDWVKLMPWLASFASLLVSYVTWGRGVLLVNARANLWDNFLPFSMGIAEFALFAVLYQSKSEPTTLWLNWLVCLSIHSFFGAAVVSHRLHVTNIARDYEKALVPLGRQLDSWLRKDRWGAALISVSSLVLWAAERLWIFPGHTVLYCGVVQFVITIPFAIGLMLVAMRADKQRRQIDAYVSNLAGASTAIAALAGQDFAPTNATLVA